MLLSLVQRVGAFASLAVLALGGYFGWSWWRLYEALEPAPGEMVDTQVSRLWVGGALILLAFVGRPLALVMLGQPGRDEERLVRPRGKTLETASGARLCVEAEGPAAAPAMIFLHGWGLDGGIWWDARRRLARRFRVVVYDLAGLGRSKPPRDGRITLERLADDLAAVVRDTAPRKVILVGHSIGGMIILTFCRRYPEMLHRQVAGVVLENTTAANPGRCTILREHLFAARIFLRALWWLDIWLQPLVWLMNWQSYFSGFTHLAVRLGGFGSRPTHAQLDQAAAALTRNSPAIQAKGNLAMLKWSLEDELPAIRVPTLVFVGRRDLVTIAEAGEFITWRISRARLHAVVEAGHLGPLECAQEYTRVIESFADQLFAASPRGAERSSGPRRTIALLEEHRARRPPEARPSL